MWNIILDEQEKIVLRQVLVNGKFTSYWLLNKLVPFSSLQEYHRGILNMHVNLLLM